jgi:phage terminase large subunit-like protein
MALSPRELRIKTAPVFEPFLRPSRYKGAHGGRGSGKSHFFAELAVERCIERPGTRIVCVREVQKSLKESVKLLIEDKIRALGMGAEFGIHDKEIKTPGGGLILFQGMQDHTAESVKSLEGFDVGYVEEAQTLSGRSLEMLRPTIRKPDSELWFSWNPRSANDPVDRLLRGEAPPAGAIVRKVNYTDNPFFPDVLEEERLHDEQHKRDRYAHIWLGEYEPMALGAIWDRLTIHQGRRSEEQVPALERIIVAVDPAISSEEGSNETGIVVAGLGDDQRGYVLDDFSTVGSPRHWAERAVAAYDLHEADAVVIETNQGGEMCRATLKSIRPALRIIEVTATRGKHVRAEPISALYSLGKIHHVGTFSKLEDQMCLMTAAGYEGEGSPDRVDALVWALTELFPKMVRRARDPRNPPPTHANGAYSPLRGLRRG